MSDPGAGKGKKGASDPLSIGNLAITKGYATKEDIISAVLAQDMKIPLGEILVAQDVLSRDQLKDLLDEQEVLREKARRSDIAKWQLKQQRSHIRDVAESLKETACEMRAFAASNKA